MKANEIFIKRPGAELVFWRTSFRGEVVIHTEWIEDAQPHLLITDITKEEGIKIKAFIEEVFDL